MSLFPVKPGFRVVKVVYEKVVGEQLKRAEELRDPHIIYVTDLVQCTHKFHARKHYPELALVFEPSAVLGSIAHMGLGRLLEERGFKVEVEVSKSITLRGENYTVKGRVDAVDEAGKVVVEVKTARAAVGLPKEHHVKQLNIYLNMLGYEEGILVYITPSRIVEYSVSREPLDLEQEVVELLENKHHPRYNWECKYCVFSKLCPYYVETSTMSAKSARSF
ncbi:MAG: CRISPR-associated protein Cas4 [Desulfurococcaceae archaeon]